MIYMKYYWYRSTVILHVITMRYVVVCIPASAKSPNVCVGWELGSVIKGKYACMKSMASYQHVHVAWVPSAGRSMVNTLWGYLAPFNITWWLKYGIFFLLPTTWAFSWQHGVNFPSLKLFTCFLVTWGCSQWGKLVAMLGGYGVHKNSPQGVSVAWSSSPW